MSRNKSAYYRLRKLAPGPSAIERKIGISRCVFNLCFGNIFFVLSELAVGQAFRSFRTILSMGSIAHRYVNNLQIGTASNLL